MQPFILADSEVIPVVALAGAAAVFIIGILFGSIKRISQTREREITRREIAAYVAEGSMTAEEGERLLRVPDSQDE